MSDWASPLTREIVNATAGPAADISDRAEDHLKRAIELAPSSIKPLMELSELEAILAVRSSDPAERSDRYHQGQELLKQVLASGTGKPDLYLKLANLERDEFSPAISRLNRVREANPAQLEIPKSAIRFRSNTEP